MARITQTFATPESWSADLPQRAVFYDPVHGEMVGADVVDDTLTERNALSEPSFQMDVVGDYAYPELFGDYPLPIEIISGDEDDEGESEAPSEDESPENAPSEEEPEDVQSIEPQPDDTGPLPPPGFSPVSGPTATSVVRPTNPAQAVASVASRIQAKIRARDPRTIASVKKLAVHARKNPHARAALKVILKKKKPVRSRGRHRGWIRGEDVQIALGGVSGVATRVVRTALVPVKWAAETSGTMVEGVGHFLESLGRKV